MSTSKSPYALATGQTDRRGRCVRRARVTILSRTALAAGGPGPRRHGKRRKEDPAPLWRRCHQSITIEYSTPSGRLRAAGEEETLRAKLHPRARRIAGAAGTTSPALLHVRTETEQRRCELGGLMGLGGTFSMLRT